MAPSDNDYKVAQRVLSEGRYIALATSTKRGLPWCSPLFYALTPNLSFVFISSPDSRHAANIRDTGRAAWAVYWGEKPPEETDGLQFAGEARELGLDEEAIRYGNVLYDQRFTVSAERHRHPITLEKLVASSRRLYLLLPEEAHKVDPTDPRGVSRLELSLSELMGRGVPRVSAR